MISSPVQPKGTSCHTPNVCLLLTQSWLARRKSIIKQGIYSAELRWQPLYKPPVNFYSADNVPSVHESKPFVCAPRRLYLFIQLVVTLTVRNLCYHGAQPASELNVFHFN